MELLTKIKNFIWSRKFVLHIGLIFLAYILLFVCVKWILSYSTNHGQKIEVPNLVGKNQNNLKNLLAGVDLKIEVLDSLYDPTKVEGTVLEQDPAPTSLSDIYVKAGRTIKIRVSKRTQLVEVPDLVYKSQRFAEVVLRNREFKYKVEYTPSQEAHGAVVELLYQGKSIAKGRRIPIGSTLKLIIGRDVGGVPLELPSLYGLTIDEARERVMYMQNTEFLVACDDCITKADSSMARIFSQSPEYTEGAIISSGGSILVNAKKDFVPTPK